MAIVRNVRVGHEHVVVADLGDAAAPLGASMNRHEFAKHVAIADDQFRRLAMELQILRNQPDRRQRKDLVPVSDFRWTLDDCRCADAAITAKPHMLPDHRVRTDHAASADDGVGMDDGTRVDGDAGSRRGTALRDHCRERDPLRRQRCHR